MNKYQKRLLEAVKAAVNEESLTKEEATSNDYEKLFELSEKQYILPLVFDIQNSNSGFKKVYKQEYKKTQKKALHQAIRQIVQTNDFLTILLHAQAQGLDPIVLKGIVCRDLYPQPCLRPSVDEDLLINPKDTEKYHKFFLSEGLFSDDNYTFTEREEAAELSYHKENSPTYIELHKYLFDPKSKACGNLNQLFDDIYNSDERVQIEDVSVRTLTPTNHLLYLVLHAYKHFIHSGIGIRPICDIGMFSECYRERINWDRFRSQLNKVNVIDFARALFQVIKLYIFPNALFFNDISEWNLDGVDVDFILEDLFESGVHGASSITRLHSSNITLQAVENSKEGQINRTNSLISLAFPSVEKIKGQYHYLNKAPFLLPVAWIQRSFKYISERKKSRKSGFITESIKIGKHRTELMKQYNIIENSPSEKKE